ncbi:methyl-accepting chemotaxis protein [Kushneria indalinina]|uniref:Methyl-accepting chemotaxis sensory transducer with TarH sensor n=1 Tax=Kushneria indalinina DSM 14324 TaxID=1122140 RepID=A0A3D9DUB6_9GAMM|nr:methyl-accepting chemotaxis protein [Kushneria indalinina]REC94368.1 methyl-accepting chemotaxis sensory transducer with TarH sensor [Kushneria indalinina DSM 14324]
MFRLTLRTGLFGVLGLFLAMMLLLGLGSAAALQQGRTAFNTLYTLNIQQLGTANTVYSDLMRTRVLLDTYQTQYNRLKVKQARLSWESAEKSLEQARTGFAQWPAQALPSPQQALVDQVRADITALTEEAITPAFEALAQWDISRYQQLSEQANALTAELDQSMQQLAEAGNAGVLAASQGMARNLQWVQWGGPLAALVMFALVGGIVMLSRRYVLRPLDHIRHTFQRISQGHLDTPEPMRCRLRDIRDLVEGMMGMQHALRDLARQLQKDSHAQQEDASALARNSHVLADQCQQQEGAVEKTTAGMAAIMASVAQTADHARQCRELAGATTAQLETANGQTLRATDMIDTALARSRESLDIITLIDAIAFQTNLLALNASVEAARAGEQGRGFSVVASEVRALSNRSAEAARNIRELITTTHDTVSQSATLIKQSEETLDQVGGHAKALTELLEGIAHTSHQQRDSVQQMEHAIQNIASATRRNAALSTQTLEATRTLDARARQQAQSAGHFHVADTLEAEHEQPCLVETTDQEITRDTLPSSDDHQRHANVPAPLPA